MRVCAAHAAVAPSARTAHQLSPTVAAPSQLKDVQPKMQEDLTLPNHLSGLRKKYLQLLFDSTRDMMTVRKTLLCHATPTRGRSAAAPQRRGA